MPPGLCLTSKRSVGTGWAARTFSRMAAHLLAQRGEVARGGQHGAAHRLEPAPGAPAPAQKRARVMAWCSQVQAVLLPRPRW
jgi:hypothetical protein